MAKLLSSVCLLVTVVLCVEGMRFDPPPQPRLEPGKHFPNRRKNDPRCNKGDGLFGNPDDCTSYFKCKNGESQDLKCPEGFKFDSVRYCTPDEDADCGKKSQRLLPENGVCVDYYGVFKVKGDCRKYVICKEGKPTYHECPEHNVYNDVNGGCVPGDVCPEQHTDDLSGKAKFVCEKADELYPDPKNCLKYIKCVNRKPHSKKCPRGKAFDHEKKTCTEEQLKTCKNSNDLLHVMRSDE